MCGPLLAMSSDSWLNDIEEGLCHCDGIGEAGQQGRISFLLYEPVLQLLILADDGEEAVLRHAPDSIWVGAFLVSISFSFAKGRYVYFGESK